MPPYGRTNGECGGVRHKLGFAGVSLLCTNGIGAPIFQEYPRAKGSGKVDHLSGEGPAMPKMSNIAAMYAHRRELKFCAMTTPLASSPITPSAKLLLALVRARKSQAKNPLFDSENLCKRLNICRRTLTNILANLEATDFIDWSYEKIGILKITALSKEERIERIKLCAADIDTQKVINNPKKNTSQNGQFDDSCIGKNGGAYKNSFLIYILCSLIVRVHTPSRACTREEGDSFQWRVHIGDKNPVDWRAEPFASKLEDVPLRIRNRAMRFLAGWQTGRTLTSEYVCGWILSTYARNVAAKQLKLSILDMPSPADVRRRVWTMRARRYNRSIFNFPIPNYGQIEFSEFLEAAIDFVKNPN